MAIVIGRDMAGNAVAFHADTQVVETDVVQTAEGAHASSGTTNMAITGTLSVAGTLKVTGALTAPLIPINAITAYHTAQTQAGAKANALLKAGQVNVVTCANAGDVLCLPPAVAGTWLEIDVSAAAQNTAIWAYEATATTLDGTNASAAGSAVTFTKTNRIAYVYCNAAGVWVSALFGAKIS